MADNIDKKGFFRTFYSNHPILSHFIFILLTGIMLLVAGMIFLNFWTRHGENTVVPDIKNMSYEQAALTLRGEGLDIAIADSVYNNKIAPGTVLESWPHAGAVVKSGREVYVTICSFQPKKVKITMPLTGVSSRQAMSFLQSLGINNIRIEHVPSLYADLVEHALYRDKNLLPGMEIPVTATVTLQVGMVVPTVEEDSIPAESDESQVIDELSGIYD